METRRDGYSRFRGHIQIQAYTTGVVHNKLDIDVFGAITLPSSLSENMFRHIVVHGSKDADIWVYKFCLVGVKLQDSESGPENAALAIPAIEVKFVINSTRVHYPKLQGGYLTNRRDTEIPCESQKGQAQIFCIFGDGEA